MAGAFDLWVAIAVDVVIFGLLAAGIVMARKVNLGKVESLGAAFGQLEGSLVQSFPDLSNGFTWREGVARARRLNLKVDWGRVGVELDRYESFRYGSGEQPGAGSYEVMRLAALLRRGRLGL